MSKNVLIAAAVILVLVVLGWYFTQSKTSSPVTNPTESSSPSSAASPEASMSANMVSITSTGYSPKDLTVKVGDSVTWKNDDSANHNVNSDPHPTHTLFSFLNLGTIKPGESKSVTFDKAGKYTYHDHLNPSLTGTVTVQ